MGFFIEKHTRHPILGRIKSKLCSFCKAWAKNKIKNNHDLDTPEHHCYKNFEGKSGAMEPEAAAEIVRELHDNFHVNVSFVCMDDDASTKQAIRWSNEDYLTNHNTTVLPQVTIAQGKNKGKLKDRPNTGKLPGHIMEPKVVSDPNHRRKLLTKQLLELASSGVKNNLTITKMDVRRLGKNYGYMARTLPHLTEDQYCFAAKAVLEHHFDNHVYCGNWC
jgi:hypothetical protein